jgi:hypothetical protein
MTTSTSQPYVPISYKDMHTYLSRRFKAWYATFKPEHDKARAEVELEEAHEGDVVRIDGDVGDEARPARVSFRLDPPGQTEPGAEGGQATGEASGKA